MSSLSIPGVQIGKSSYPLTKIDLNHDCSTSADWGFVQPLMCKKMIAKSTLHLNALRSIVRVSPLSKPTFGSANWKTYHRFIPIEYIMPTYPYMLKREPYYVADRTSNYIPEQMPWIYVSDLTRILLAHQNAYSIWASTTEGEYKLSTSFSTAIHTALYNAVESKLSLSNGEEAASSSSLDRGYEETRLDYFIHPDSADFVMFTTTTYSNVSYNIMVCFKLSRKCRNIRKILIGLGYQLDPNLKREVCILPLMAFYRAYFDLFFPKRDQGWSATSAFHILDYIREYGVTDIVSSATVRVAFKSFLEELAACYYVDDNDFIGAHVATPAISNTSQTLEYSSASNGVTEASGMLAELNASRNMQPSAFNVNITHNLIRALDKFTKAINKDTTIAHRVDEWMAAHGFGRALTDIDPYKIGSDKVPIDIKSVMSTAETEEAGLGDFAGTAVGFKDNGDYPSFHYTAETTGYWITLGCCVPDSGWFQGLAPDTGVLDFRRLDEYWSEYDALSFDVSNKDQVVCDGSVSDLTTTLNDPEPLGFIPRSSRYKVTQNIVNGNLSLRSTQAEFLPYTLDRYITPSQCVVESSTNPGQANEILLVSRYTESIPAASSEYRYIGKNLFMGNFDRIFQLYDQVKKRMESNPNSDYNLHPSPDHFVIHNYFDVTYMAPVLSLKDSYDTDSFDKSSMEVEKA